jgi:hypothetical protein
MIQMLELIHNLILDNHVILGIAFTSAVVMIITGAILSSIIK